MLGSLAGSVYVRGVCVILLGLWASALCVI